MAQNYYKKAAIIVGGAVAVPVTLAIVGFAPAGIAAGSIAAGIQSGIGNVVAGSVFAVLQSAATAPVVTSLVGGAAAAGGIVVTYAARFFRRR